MPRPSPKPFQWIYPARMGRALGTTEKRAGGLLHAPLGTRLKFWENVNLAASVLHHHTGTLTALESAKDLFSFTLNVNGTPAAQGYASGRRQVHQLPGRRVLLHRPGQLERSHQRGCGDNPDRHGRPWPSRRPWAPTWRGWDGSRKPGRLKKLSFPGSLPTVVAPRPSTGRAAAQLGQEELPGSLG